MSIKQWLLVCVPFTCRYNTHPSIMYRYLPYSLSLALPLTTCPPHIDQNTHTHSQKPFQANVYCGKNGWCSAPLFKSDFYELTERRAVRVARKVKSDIKFKYLILSFSLTLSHIGRTWRREIQSKAEPLHLLRVLGFCISVIRIHSQNGRCSPNGAMRRLLSRRGVYVLAVVVVVVVFVMLASIKRTSCLHR